MIFLGCLFDRQKEQNILNNSKISLPNSTNVFQWNIIEGILKNNQNLSIINVLPIGVFPKYYKKLFLKTRQWKYKNVQCKEIGCLNIPLIKQYQRFKRCRKELQNSNDKDILIYSTYEPFLKAIYKLPKEYHTTLIVPDLPEFFDLSKTSTIRKIARKINNKKITKYLKRIDKYILLTEQMKEKLPIDKKPYVVIEGICNDDNLLLTKTKKSEKQILLYAGSYRLSNGLENLIKAFTKINNKNIELWTCGKGEATELIQKYASKDERIKDLGYRTHDEIIKFEQQSTLLINPRQNTEEYTKYSFPSKTMEYLASGTPVLMYKLDGIPKEYDNYIYYIEGNTIKDLANAINNILSKPKEELDEFGKKAQKWILKNKNSKSQTEKILKMIQAL